MKALVARGVGQYALEEVEIPNCGDEDILIKTEACGICAGDLKCYQGAERFWGGDNQPMWVNPPFIPGHEFFGRVVKVGNRRSDFKVGDRVIAEQIVPCDECYYCKTGKYWMCEPHATYGFQLENNGGMAEYVRFSKHARVHKIPESMTIEEALLIEPYGCSKHAVDRANITNEDVVVIAGSGTLGLGMVTYARLKNPRKLIVLDLNNTRLEKAKEFGADIVINPNELDVVEEVKKLTGGYGCDVYIEATGHPSSVVQGLEMIRKLGRFIEFSVFDQKTSVDWSIIGDGKELDLLGAHLSPNCYPFVIEGISNGKLKTEGVVSSHFKLDDWEEAFEKAKGKDGDTKVAFVFGE